MAALSAYLGYQERTTSGLYDKIFQKLQDLNPYLLANLTWDTDFKHDPAYAREFIHTSNGGRFSTFIFGEIAPVIDGTIHSAMGNHFVGTAPKYFSRVTDDSTIKDIFMLRSPTEAPENLKLLFEYQLAVLNNMREHDAVVEDSKGIPITHVTEIIRSVDEVSQPNLIAAHIGPKYVIPKHLATVVPSNAHKSKPKAKRVYAERNEISNPDPTPSNPDTGSVVTPSDVTIGELYDPRLLPDYGGPMFRHTHAKLVQKDMTDEDGNLIPAWQTYDKLRAGTLVLMKGQITMYQMEDKQKDGIKKFYHFNMHRTYVLARSDEPMEVKEIPRLPNFMTEMQAPTKRDAADDVLDSVFSLKRSKNSLEDSVASSSSREPGESSSAHTEAPKKVVNPRKGKTTRTKKNDGKQKDKNPNDADDIVEHNDDEDAMPIDDNVE
ncbi:hypothetical protein F5887DRAFT_1068195 [Amanita rubescens]|nr:hypothetical protein F5887DRAFT_1068195 [Amanita rubescens]